MKTKSTIAVTHLLDSAMLFITKKMNQFLVGGKNLDQLNLIDINNSYKKNNFLF